MDKFKIQPHSLTISKDEGNLFSASSYDTSLKDFNHITNSVSFFQNNLKKNKNDENLTNEIFNNFNLRPTILRDQDFIKMNIVHTRKNINIIERQRTTTALEYCIYF